LRTLDIDRLTSIRATDLCDLVFIRQTDLCGKTVKHHLRPVAAPPRFLRCCKASVFTLSVPFGVCVMSLLCELGYDKKLSELHSFSAKCYIRQPDTCSFRSGSSPNTPLPGTATSLRFVEKMPQILGLCQWQEHSLARAGIIADMPRKFNNMG
jgi:hypothetical protein